MKDKKRNKITGKEFMKRWGQGIRGITPYQQANIIYKNTYLMIVGFILGIIYAIYYIENVWWLLVILISALINTVVVQIGNYQKYKTLEEIENVMADV